MRLKLPALDELQQYCPKCLEANPAWTTVCAKCGNEIASPRYLRVTGIFYLTVGVGVAGVLLWVMVWMALNMMHTNDPGAKTRYTGTAFEAAMALGIVGFVCVFGLTAIAMGLWQITTGTRSKAIIRIGVLWYTVLWLGYDAYMYFEMGREFFTG